LGVGAEKPAVLLTVPVYYQPHYSYRSRSDCNNHISRPAAQPGGPPRRPPPIYIYVTSSRSRWHSQRHNNIKTTSGGVPAAGVAPPGLARCFMLRIALTRNWVWYLGQWVRAPADWERKPIDWRCIDRLSSVHECGWRTGDTPWTNTMISKTILVHVRKVIEG